MGPLRKSSNSLKAFQACKVGWQFWLPKRRNFQNIEMEIWINIKLLFFLRKGFSNLFFVRLRPQRMQLDIILTSLQDHTHVASLLGYSSPADGPEILSSGLSFSPSPDPTYSSPGGHPDTHLAEILMKTLLRNLGFYTVSASWCCRRRVIDHWMSSPVRKPSDAFRIDNSKYEADRKWSGSGFVKHQRTWPGLHPFGWYLAKQKESSCCWKIWG